MPTIDIAVSDQDLESFQARYYSDTIFISQVEVPNVGKQRVVTTIMANKEEAKQLIVALQEFVAS